MLLAQGRYWRCVLGRGRDAVVLTILKDELPDDLSEVRDLRVEIPLARWNAVIKHVESDRKLLGGILLDDASPKEPLARVVASDRLLAGLQRVARDATMVLVETGLLVLCPPTAEED